MLGIGGFDRSRSRKTSGAHRKAPNSCESGYQECFTALIVRHALKLQRWDGALVEEWSNTQRPLRLCGLCVEWV